MARHSLKVAVALAVAAIGLGAANAKAVLLSTLVSGGGTLTAGGVTFSNFNYFDNTPPGTQINVSTSTSGNQAFITFTVTSGTWSAANNHSQIDFNVDSSSNITAVTGSFVATAGTQTGEFATVGETVTNRAVASTDPHHDQVISPALFVDGPGKLTDVTSTSLTLFAPTKTLSIVKSIDLGADATISSVTNGYVMAPEPASLGILSVAGVSLLVRRRRAVR